MQKLSLVDGLCLPTVQISTIIHCNSFQFRLTHTKRQAPTERYSFCKVIDINSDFWSDTCRGVRVATKEEIVYTLIRTDTFLFTYRVGGLFWKPDSLKCILSKDFLNWKCAINWDSSTVNSEWLTISAFCRQISCDDK